MNLEPTATSMSKDPPAASTAAIRELNDSLRTTFIGGAVHITHGVENLPTLCRGALLRAVRAFDAFDGSNDTYAEHDFGAIDLEGSRFFWKIDYYDMTMEAGSPEPADPSITRRVLTIMRAEEY